MAETPTGKQWYALYVQPGFEHKVQSNIEQRLQCRGLQEYIARFFIPIEDIEEMQDGVYKIVHETVLPGYIFIQFNSVIEGLWQVLKSTPGVMNIVCSGRTPTPLSIDEIEPILQKYDKKKKPRKTRSHLVFKKGEMVQIVDGPFCDFIGIVKKQAKNSSKLKVTVEVFGRPTVVELHTLQVSKL